LAKISNGFAAPFFHFSYAMTINRNESRRLIILTFEFLAKYQSLPDGRPLVLSLYCRVKKSFWLPHSLAVVDDQSGAYGVLEAADDCFKERGPSFPSTSTSPSPRQHNFLPIRSSQSTT
jgi:hypothetical protein